MSKWVFYGKFNSYANPSCPMCIFSHGPFQKVDLQKAFPLRKRLINPDYAAPKTGGSTSQYRILEHCNIYICSLG